MANNLTGNPWVITDAATVTTGLVRVLRMRWQEPTAADDLTITDGAGRTIFDDNAIAGGAGISLEWDFGGKGVLFDGFIVSVIDGGTLYVYIQ